mmetsp:Transcript_28823/g.77034  ORF Transcript_28823/g.77034 Transcript_28823/m.77034 type:complete len:307 (-) Transcript_28823:187-1107(-)
MDIAEGFTLDQRTTHVSSPSGLDSTFCAARRRRAARRPLRRARQALRRWWPAGMKCPPLTTRWWPAGAPPPPAEQHNFERHNKHEEQHQHDETAEQYNLESNEQHDNTAEQHLHDEPLGNDVHHNFDNTAALQYLHDEDADEHNFENNEQHDNTAEQHLHDEPFGNDEQHNFDNTAAEQHMHDEAAKHNLVNDEQHSFDNTAAVQYLHDEPAEYNFETKPCFDCGAPALLVKVRKRMPCSECEMDSQHFFFCEEGCRAMLCRQCTEQKRKQIKQNQKREQGGRTEVRAGFASPELATLPKCGKLTS